MKSVNLTILFLILLLCESLFCQEMEIMWERLYQEYPDSSRYYAAFNSVHRAQDGGFVLGGVLCPELFVMSSWIIKVDRNGEIFWEYFHEENVHGSGRRKLLKRNENEYILVTSFQLENLRKQPVLICISNEGEELWHRMYNADFQCFPDEAIVLNNGNILLRGRHSRPAPGVPTYFLYLISGDGDSLDYREYYKVT